jgi:CyaY protein
MTHALAETEFRKLIQDTLDRIERAFADVDPDIAECEQSLGSMTITLSDRSRCILSTQPSVRQLWLALASRGIAFHFNYDTATRTWVDDKGKGIELLSYLKGFLKESTGLDLSL